VKHIPHRQDYVDEVNSRLMLMKCPLPHLVKLAISFSILITDVKWSIV
jgi:hypothetical protein